METLLSVSLIFSFLFIFFKLIIQKFVQCKNLPPSPPSLPIIGHLHILKRAKSSIHCTLHKISIQYGPILFLKFGSRPVLVVSTPSAVEECLSKHDIIFANRPSFASWKILEYNFSSLATAPYGHHWRNLRRFTVLEIFSAARVQMSSTIRTEEIRFLAKQLFTKGAQKVDLKSFFYMLASNIMMQMVTGNRYFDGDVLDDSGERRHKYDDIMQNFSPSKTIALADLFPSLRWLNFLGQQRKTMRRHKKRDVFMQALIDARRKNGPSNSALEGEKRQTIISAMLSLQESEPHFYTDEIIKGIIQTMLIAGTKTSALTMESAGSFLMSHLDVLKKAREEIDANVEPSRLLDDGDLSKLTYLQCIINETLRLGPTVPIIPPRESLEECTIGGFNVPRGTMLMVNTSALHKDPSVWDDPNTFKPERFQDTEGDKAGGFKFIPFGSGRRRCPGVSLAMRLMALSLGTLIQCFDWEEAEEDCVGTETGHNMANDKPIKVIFRPRKTLINALSQL